MKAVDWHWSSQLASVSVECFTRARRRRRPSSKSILLRHERDVGTTSRRILVAALWFCLTQVTGFRTGCDLLAFHPVYSSPSSSSKERDQDFGWKERVCNNRLPRESGRTSFQPFLLMVLRSRSRSFGESVDPQEQQIGIGTASENNVRALASRVVEFTQARQFEPAFHVLNRMVQQVKNNRNNTNSLGTSNPCCRAVDDAFKIFTHTVLEPQLLQRQPNGASSLQSILLGVHAIHIQLSLSGYVMEPYNKVPHSTLVKALQALTHFNQVHDGNTGAAAPRNQRPYLSTAKDQIPQSYSTLSFRILQRLITGVGVRNSTTGREQRVHEKDINMVLNTFSNAGQMQICQRILALQLRSNRTPPISPASYSILLKGYGKLGDLTRVESVLQHAMHNSYLQPDTIFMNSLIAAYVNCNAMDKAQEAFAQMMKTQGEDSSSTRNNRKTWFRTMPPPNRRTYNTILKGLAQTQSLQEALKLSKTMERLGMWDAVSVNTLVRAALTANDFDLARELLDQYTTPDNAISQQSQGTRRYEGEHNPHVEAYTELLDCSAKAGRLSDALGVFQLMRERNVSPNEVTFTCLVSGLARHGKVQEAYQMLSYMHSILPTTPTVVTYNSFIAALLAPPPKTSTDSTRGAVKVASTVSEDAMEQALKVLRTMIQNGVVPNPTTVSMIVDGLGRCTRPRVAEACSLVDKLHEENLVDVSNLKVMTSLLRTCGLGNDLKGVVRSFKQIHRPDRIAVNAFMDACCRCNRDTLAMEAFRYYFDEQKKPRNEEDRQERREPLEPDLVSYSILISHYLKSSKPRSREIARVLYSSMKESRTIYPDPGLVDSILKRMLSLARSAHLPKSEISFITTVLRDAEELDWAEGCLERRKRAVRSVLSDPRRRRRQGRNEDYYLDDLLKKKGSNDNDDLFRRKGWNQMDSTFRLLGPTSTSRTSAEIITSTFKDNNNDDDDEFLKSKGWNSVDSGFRIL